MPTEIHDAQKHPKQDFQVERLAFFSDAVFAIAITLLIIDFKIPQINAKSTVDEVWQQLVNLAPNIAALLASFYLIATYWIRHHFLFKHIHNYNKEVVIMNLVVLLPIIFLPFTTAFAASAIAADNKEVAVLAFRIFMVNHLLVNICIYILYWLAIVQHKEFSFRMDTDEKVKFTMDTLFQIIVLLAIICTFSIRNLKDNAPWAFAILLTVGVIKPIFKRGIKKRFQKQQAMN